jgi:hypothetical protein
MGEGLMSKRKREKMKAKERRHLKPEAEAAPVAAPAASAAPAVPVTPKSRQSGGSRRKRTQELPEQLAGAEHLKSAAPEWQQLYAAISREFSG